MLAQLVCVDRRFQRMNCFNMRELQAILKQRFFAEIENDMKFNQTLGDISNNLRFYRGGELD